MNWQKQLRILENNKQWDEAIALMQDVIKNNPDNMDAYIFMNYLLMNLLVEEYPNKANVPYYKELTKHCFDESYRKFSHNPEYLFFTGITAVMSEWYFGIELEDYEAMLKAATDLDPENDLYRISYYFGSIHSKKPNTSLALDYADLSLDPDGALQKQLVTKGAVGEYYLELTTNRAKRKILENSNAYAEEIKQHNTLTTQRLKALEQMVIYLFKEIKDCKIIEHAERYLKALDLIQQCLSRLMHTKNITFTDQLVRFAKDYNSMYELKEHYYEKIRNGEYKF